MVNVVAIQRGTSDPNRMVIMSGDIDSRISSGVNAVDSAPGANDNASGMAGTIEAARVLTRYTFNGSVVYVGLSGEEQGLYGGRTVARYAQEHGWKIQAVLNNDMIGNIEGISGVVDNTTARVFSDGTPPVDVALRELAGDGLSQAVRDSGVVKLPAREFAQILSLYGGRTVARYAQEHGWNIQAVLNNDMIGNIEGISGVVDNTTARVFSDGTPPVDVALRELAGDGLSQAVRDSGVVKLPAREFAQILRLLGSRRRTGGEVDGVSRQVARYVDRIADDYFPTLDIIMIYRLDRFGRGGHHTPFANLGYPAVRIMETNENYTRQHQDIRVENGIAYGDVLEGVNFAYAAKLTALNAATLATLAWAPGPPQRTIICGAVRAHARMAWDPPSDAQNVAGYRVYWRLTDSPTWDHSSWVGEATQHTFEGLIIDNYFFGVAAVGIDGSESVVVFPRRAGRQDRC